MDDIDIAILDMSAFEFKVECDVAYKHKGDGVIMHRGSTEATHFVKATCAYCQTETEETAVCLSFIAEAYGKLNLQWRCLHCRSLNRYSATLKAVEIR
jgi:hypothetical protein